MELKMNKDEPSSLFWLGIAGFICIGALRLPLGSFHNPGPGFLPFITGTILGALSFLLFLQSRQGTASAWSPKQIWPNPAKSKKMVLAIFALLAYAVGMEYLGFLPSTIIFLAFLLKVIEPQRWSVVVFGSLAAAIGSYLIFECWLQSQLPKGLFEFF